MPPLEEADHYDKVVVWDATGKVDDYGDYQIEGPRQIYARWEWGSGKQTGTDSQGNTVKIDATVFVNEEIILGSKMWLGALANLPSDLTHDFVYEVIGFDSTNDLKSRVSQRDCNIMRYRGTLPSDVGTGS